MITSSEIVEYVNYVMALKVGYRVEKFSTDPIQAPVIHSLIEIVREVIVAPLEKQLADQQAQIDRLKHVVRDLGMEMNIAEPPMMGVRPCECGVLHVSGTARQFCSTCGGAY